MEAKRILVLSPDLAMPRRDLRCRPLLLGDLVPRAPVLDPVARGRERAVDPFDGRNGCGTGRQRKGDGRDIQPFDHDLTPAVRSSARSSSAATITAPEMASASRMAGIVSASIMGRVLRFRWVWDWKARRVRAVQRPSQSILAPLPRWRVFPKNWLQITRRDRRPLFSEPRRRSQKNANA